MIERKTNSFDFETLSVLAQTDPGSFETLRRQAIEEAIARAPQECRQRLRRLQWRIDRVRETSGTPLAACIHISNMMWNAFNDLNRLYRQLEEPVDTAASGLDGSRSPRPNGRIVPFRRPAEP